MIKFFENMPSVLAIMSERADGSMKLLPDNSNAENRNKFFHKIGISAEKIISADLANGTRVAIVSADSPQIISATDALVAKDKNIFLAVTIADCIPVYFYEPQHNIIALAHCGWRGIVGGIIKNTSDKIFELGVKGENLQIALGPGIDKCHFEIKEDVLDKFSGHKEFIITRENKLFVDLKGIIRKQLAEAGIRLEKIESNQDCTFESDRYFSVRRDKPQRIEAMMAVIGIKSGQ